MSTVMQDYAKTLPLIYRDILAVFPKAEPARKAHWGLAYQSLYEALERRISLSEIIQACENMEQAGVVTIKNKFFVHPTDLGEEIITELTGKKAAQQIVPPFPKPPHG